MIIKNTCNPDNTKKQHFFGHKDPKNSSQDVFLCGDEYLTNTGRATLRHCHYDLHLVLIDFTTFCSNNCLLMTCQYASKHKEVLTS